MTETASPKMELPELQVLEEREPYADFARRLQETCLVSDPWYDGEPIVRSAPVVVPPALYRALMSSGQRIGALFNELCARVWDEPELLESFFYLPPHYRLMWLHSGGHWHGFARMDMFVTDAGVQVCEFNADTPTGQVEGVVPGQLMRTAYPELIDCNADYERRFCDMLARIHAARAPDVPRSRVGLLYPTDLPEDITLVRMYSQWLESRGLEVVHGAPSNLSRHEGGVALLGTPIGQVLRHYKTDWWGERPPLLRSDAPVVDALPLSRELGVLLDAEQRGQVSVVNPFGSLLPQDKLALAFLWEEKDRFSEEAQRTIEELIPLTRRLSVCDRDVLRAERELWVLKSDFGCEGDEVVVGANVTAAQWDQLLDDALDEVWVAQRFFRVRPVAGGGLPNFGVYLVAGQPSGLLVRVARPGNTSGNDATVLTPMLSGADAEAAGQW